MSVTHLKQKKQNLLSQGENEVLGEGMREFWDGSWLESCKEGHTNEEKILVCQQGAAVQKNCERTCELKILTIIFEMKKTE